MENGLFDEKKVKEEVKRHREHLNLVLGFAMFTVGVACLGTPNPQLTATFAFPVLVALIFASIRYAPETMITLRELEKGSKDPEVKEARVYLEKKYHSFWALLRGGFLYWYGVAFYLLVFGSPLFVEWIRKI